jgi:Tfp pilus assembly protein FimV
LGEVQVESQLNQPLRARIEIVGVGDLDNAPPIRARFAPDLVASDAANAGLLRSLKLSLEEDSSHRHFVVVSSTEPLTEPLFDLPLQVAAESVQVVRNYSVLLDPPPLEERGRSTLAVIDAGKPVAASRAAFRGGKRHLRVGAKLQGQLVTLQQMLAKMQETISAQDAQIAELTRRIAIGQAQPADALTRVPPTRVELPPPAVAQETVADEEPSFWLRPVTYYSIAAMGIIGAILALVITRLRKASAGSAADGVRTPLTAERGFADSRDAAELESGSEERSGTTSVTVPAPAPFLVRTSATHGYEVLDRLATTQETAIVNELAMAIGSALAQSPETALDLDTTARIDRGADATVEMTHQDLLRISEHNVVDATDRLLPQMPMSAQKLDMQPDGSVTNKEIIKLLERSLDAEPHRTDIQLKLLEMYHQEALGQRERFHSLLGKVAAEHRALSPAQQLHLDMLQRTLDDSKTDSVSHIPAEAAV